MAILRRGLIFSIILFLVLYNLLMATPLRAQKTATPSEINIVLPQNNSICTANEILLSITVGLPEIASATNTYIITVNYKLDFQQNNTIIYDSGSTKIDDRIDSTLKNKLFNYTTNLASVPAGNHSLTVYVLSGYSFFDLNKPDYFDRHQIQSNATVFFEVDAQTNPSPTLPEIPITGLLITVVAAVSILLVFGKRKPLVG
jgi:hypothetical protein